MTLSRSIAHHFTPDEQQQGVRSNGVDQYGISAEHVTMITVDLKKGYYEPMHRHVHEQVFYMVKGCMRVTFKGEQPTVDVKAGDFIWFPSNVDHDALAVEDSFAVEVFSPVRPEIFKPT